MKTITKLVIGIVILVGVAALILLGRSYYDDRYVGTPYYGMVPMDYDVTPRTIKASGGEDMGKGVEYKLTVYNEAGESRVAEWTVFTDIETPPAPGTLLLVKHSKQVVTGWNAVEKNQVPEKLLDKIQSNE
jgi:uncharacterized protein (TIGR01655 family)